jgi:hypothetical protein
MVVSYESMSDVATLTSNCYFLHYYSVTLFKLDKQCMCHAGESLLMPEASHTSPAPLTNCRCSAGSGHVLCAEEA